MKFTSEEIRNRLKQREEELRQPGAILFSQSRYEIQRVLGEGGMGITCLANEFSAANLKRPVVLKFVKDSLDPNRLARFLNEVQLSILFNHPNLVPIFRLESETLHVKPSRSWLPGGRTHGHVLYYAVMQYIDGWNMRQLVNRLRGLRIALHHDITVFIIARIARGLQYVHEYKDTDGRSLGLVHRDVSPENVLMDRYGRIKMGDFGLTRPARELRTEEEGGQAGKILYCAPEQIDGSTLDARADIYNLGLLMYYMFTNQDRFAPELQSEDRVRERIRAKMRRSPLEELEHVSPRLAHICDICMREDPSERYQNCEDLATDIDIYFKETQKVVTNEQLMEVLQDLFSNEPQFVSRRFIPLTGSPKLEQPQHDPGADEMEAEHEAPPLRTVPLNQSGEKGSNATGEENDSGDQK